MNTLLSMGAFVALASMILVIHDQEVYRRLTVEMLMRKISDDSLQESLENYARYSAQSRSMTFPQALSITYPVKAIFYYQNLGNVIHCCIDTATKKWTIDWIVAE